MPPRHSAWCCLEVPCQSGHRAELAVIGHRPGRGLAGVRMGGTVQVLMAENRQFLVPGWCRVAQVHGEQREMCVATVKGGTAFNRPA